MKREEDGMGGEEDEQIDAMAANSRSFDRKDLSRERDQERHR
jgi:hypothetical protein